MKVSAFGIARRCAARGLGTLAVLLLACVRLPSAAWANSLLPLVTQEAETLRGGVAEATIGIAYFRNGRHPPFTPPHTIRSQTLIGLPQIGFRIGAGDWAEIQASYETLYLDEEATNGQTNWQFGSGDARLFTKVWLRREHRLTPALGLRFGTKLPNATRGSRLGTDDTDFGGDVLASKRIGPVTTHVNLGILLLGNSGPSIGDSFTAGGQDDLFTYAVALASKPLTTAATGTTTLRLLGEVAGQAGSRFDNDRSALSVGVQFHRGAGTVYLGVNAGLVTGSQEFGASTGFTYTFDLGKLLEGE